MFEIVSDRSVRKLSHSPESASKLALQYNMNPFQFGYNLPYGFPYLPIQPPTDNASASGPHSFVASAPPLHPLYPCYGGFTPIQPPLPYPFHQPTVWFGSYPTAFGSTLANVSEGAKGTGPAKQTNSCTQQVGLTRRCIGKLSCFFLHGTDCVPEPFILKHVQALLT